MKNYTSIIKITLRLVLAATLLFGGWGIGYCKEQSNTINLFENHRSVSLEDQQEIEHLLDLHDQCKFGYAYPDSAVVYTMQALDLINKTYGFDSEKFIDTYTDFMIPDLCHNRQLVCNSLYKDVTELFSPNTSYIWRCYYELGRVMLSFNEYEKAYLLFNKSYKTAHTLNDKLKSKIQLVILQHNEEGGDLADQFGPLCSQLRKLDTQQYNDLFSMMNYYVAESYVKENRFDDAMRFIEYAESWGKNSPLSQQMLIQQLKYDLLIEKDHIRALKCLDKMVYMSSNSDISEEDREWVAMALVSRGDYSLNQELNISDAVKYYMMANRLIRGKYAVYSPVIQAVTRRIVHILRLGGEYEKAIHLGKLLVDTSLKRDTTETNLHYVLELGDAYFSAERVDEAEQLLSQFNNKLEDCDRTHDKYILLRGRINIAKNNYTSACQDFESLLNKNCRKDTKLWAQRYLAYAYSQINHPAKYALSDSINSFTKYEIISQLRKISPQQRINWLRMCDEAIDWQLSLSDNDKAIYNAAELLLFRKSLLFRTSDEIRKIISLIPEYQTINEQLGSLNAKAYSNFLNNDSCLYDIQYKIDSLQQSIANKFINVESLLKRSDYKLSSVLSQIDQNSIIIDFYKSGFKGNYQLGAFIYSKSNKPQFLDLIEYDDSISNADIDTILDILHPYVSDYKNVYFSGDGLINNYALEFSDHVTVNDKCWHRLFHIADIKGNPCIGRLPILVGVSDHNSLIQHGESLDRGDWTDLPNVKYELQIIRNQLASLSPRVFFNDGARERNIKELDGNDISLLHFSTHGFYLDEDSLQFASADSSHFNHNIASRALRAGKTELSGLVLRGGNISWQSPDILDDEDDLLTADEIETLHFPNLNLVVLSACNTGLGNTDSEGVWGLQRAFRIAGCKSLICTLNKVDDYWTAQFMEEFYKNAATGMTIYDSFHSAHKTLRETPECPRNLLTSFILIE